MDPGLNALLKWGVENSTQDGADPRASQPPRSSNLTPEAINALMGGPSDADMMKSSMAAVLSTDPEVSVDDKMIAFDNFEQLIENLDNANNLEPLALWTPLLSCLTHETAGIRKMAAWCVGTAVQNNEKSQERCFAMNGLPPLVELATKGGEEKDVRRKAVYALSSLVRNYQPAMDVFVEELAKRGVRSEEKVDASDMDVVDGIIGEMRDNAAK